MKTVEISALIVLRYLTILLRKIPSGGKLNPVTKPVAI
jgi:hypothetical protein